MALPAAASGCGCTGTRASSRSSACARWRRCSCSGRRTRTCARFGAMVGLRRLEFSQGRKLVSTAGVAGGGVPRPLPAGARSRTCAGCRPRLRVLAIESCKKLGALDAVADAVGLTRLKVANCGDIASLAPLRRAGRAGGVPRVGVDAGARRRPVRAARAAAAARDRDAGPLASTGRGCARSRRRLAGRAGAEWPPLRPSLLARADPARAACCASSRSAPRRRASTAACPRTTSRRGASARASPGFAWSFLGAALAHDRAAVRRRQRAGTALPPGDHRPGGGDAVRDVPGAAVDRARDRRGVQRAHHRRAAGRPRTCAPRGCASAWT